MISKDFFGLDKSQVWDMEMAFRRLKSAGQANTKRTAERRLREWCFFPKELRPENLLNEQDRSIIGSLCNFELEKARSKRKLILFAQLAPLPSNKPCLHANDARGGRYWVPLEKETIDVEQIAAALSKLQKHLAKSVALFPHGALVLLIRRLPVMPSLTFCLLGYSPNLDLNNQRGKKKPSKPPRHFPPTHMDRLEAESIFIFREAVAGAENPVMLYSSGKDSSVMLHLARKAFFPSRPNFPLLHVDTRWKFQEMYLFRDAMALESGMKLLVHINPEAIEKNINPFDHGSALHTSITKTEGLKQVLDKNGFDVVFGGARRDEEMSRAKERIFSLRSAAHRWDPKNQRPELWNLYNTTKQKGETLRVFPLSNWTELDIWEYIYRENIPVVPLYFAKERPVVIRDGLILMVDDDRMRLLPREKIELRKVRFRTLGCYPLSGAIESQAETVPEIIMEILASSTSERQGRLIDTDTSGSMERKKHEGYF